MPDTPDTCGRELYPQKKYRGFKNIRICVDGAWITRNLVASPSSQLLSKCRKIYRNNCPSYFVIYQASIIPAHFERNFLRESRENDLAHSLLRDLVSITYCQLQLQPVEVLQQYIHTPKRKSDHDVTIGLFSWRCVIPSRWSSTLRKGKITKKKGKGR